VSDRKYRQRGYQDSGDKPKFEKSEGDRPIKKETFGPRAIQMPGTRSVSRCSQCGTVLQNISEPPGACPKCGFELHSCKQCTYFDPSGRFECMQPVKERVAKKDARNECTFYSMRVMVEKETSTPASLRPQDARQAFDNLFKK
jgi:DNA-directed RNA polymerase subunit RPC12/RpoP